jgi:hypothetical protein
LTKFLNENWLQVSASTKLSEVDECESNEFEADMDKSKGIQLNG